MLKLKERIYGRPKMLFIKAEVDLLESFSWQRLLRFYSAYKRS